MGRNAHKLLTRTNLTNNPNNGKTGSSKVVGIGSIHAVRMAVHRFDDILSVGINVTVADGNVRVKIYNESGGNPASLFGESNTTAISGTGFQDISLTSPATAPALGFVWVAFETDSATLELEFATGSSGDERTVVHTYGTGADPFGGSTNGTDEWNVRLSIEGSGIAVNRGGKLKVITVAVAGTGASDLELHAGTDHLTPHIYTADGFDAIISHKNLDISFGSGGLYAEIIGDAEFNIMYE